MSINITLMSFGFKYGLPNANYYFDVGFLKNPARENQWNFFSDIDENMTTFVMQQQPAKDLVNLLLPLIRFISTVDNNNIFAFGCSSGRHRSPVIVETLAMRLSEENVSVKVVHRDGTSEQVREK